MIFLYYFRGVGAMEIVANGHEGEKYCILDSHYVESFLEKGVLTSSCIYV